VRAYLTSVLTRDLRDIADIEKLTELPKFVRLLAEHSGQLLGSDSVSALEANNRLTDFLWLIFLHEVLGAMKNKHLGSGKDPLEPQPFGLPKSYVRVAPKQQNRLVAEPREARLHLGEEVAAIQNLFREQRLRVAGGRRRVRFHVGRSLGRRERALHAGRHQESLQRIEAHHHETTEPAARKLSPVFDVLDALRRPRPGVADEERMDEVRPPSSEAQANRAAP
jgi:hypothetical protein